MREQQSFALYRLSFDLEIKQVAAGLFKFLLIFLYPYNMTHDSTSRDLLLWEAPVANLAFSLTLQEFSLFAGKKNKSRHL